MNQDTKSKTYDDSFDEILNMIKNSEESVKNNENVKHTDAGMKVIIILIIDDSYQIPLKKKTENRAFRSRVRSDSLFDHEEPMFGLQS